MRDDARLVALLPMRAGSERVPGKNLRSICGRPLYAHILTTLLEVEEISQIIVDTDIEQVLQEAPSLSPRITAVRRPAHLATGDTAMNDVLLAAMAHSDAEHFVQTHATNPLLRASTVSRAIEEYRRNAHADSLFSVTALQARFWKKGGLPMNHDPQVLERTQDLEPIYEENSNLYIFSRDSLQQSKGRIGRRPMMFEIERDEALDIDVELDFQIAEFLLGARLASRGGE